MSIIFLQVMFLPTVINAQNDDVKAKQIDWEKLGPNGGKPFSDPFTKLSQKQLSDLSYVARVQRLIAEKKIKEDGIDAKEASDIASQLKKDGVDIVWLMQQRERVVQIRNMQLDELAEANAERFDSRPVVIKGFATAMQSKDDKVTEFLFTPTIETCGHSTTEPSPLRVIYVRTQLSVNLEKSKPTPLRLTGTLKAEKKRALFTSPDGIRTIPSAYILSPIKIETVTEVNKTKISTSN